MRTEDKKKEKESKTEPRTGSVVPEDPGLTTWLHRLWAREEPPSRIEVWQSFGLNRLVRGEMVHHHDFKAGENIDQERATFIANEIIEAAQNDCDGVQRKQHYLIVVLDKFRKASPLVRRLGPLEPKRHYLGKSANASDADDDDGAPVGWKSIALAYIEDAHEQSRWDKQRNDQVIGDLIKMYRETVLEQRTWIDGMMLRQMEMFAQLQDAKDREKDRIVDRKLAEFKVTLLEDGLRSARNLLPGLFGPDAGKPSETGQLPAKAGEKDYGYSPERVMVDNLLHDCEKTGISIALFGDWDVRDGRLEPNAEKPGIFTPEQFRILVGVQSGRLPPQALDVLMPNSGDRRAITKEQIMQAQPLMSEGTGITLLELVGLRQRRSEAAAAAGAASTTSSNNATMERDFQ